MLDKWETIAYSIGIVVCFSNFIVSTLAVIVQFRERNRFHLNYILLRITYFLACYGISIGHLGISITVLHEGTSSPTNFYTLWFYLHFLKSFCVNLLRLALISFVIERTVATTFRQCYETHRMFILVPLILSFLSYAFSFILSSMENIWYYDEIVVYSIYMIMDVFHWISATLLSKYNWRILKNNRATRSNKLSQRYQVNENIRVLEIILPISRVGCIFTLVSTWIVMVVLLTSVDNKYAAPLYYMVINAFVTVAFFMSMKAQSITPRILCRIILCQSSYRGNERSISPSHVKNILGEELIIYHHGDDHFKCLQDQWHVSFTNLHTMDPKGSPI